MSLFDFSPRIPLGTFSILLGYRPKAYNEKIYFGFGKKKKKKKKKKENKKKNKTKQNKTWNPTSTWNFS